MGTNSDAAKKLTDSCNARDVAGIASVFAPDAVMLTARAGSRVEGPDAIAEALTAWVDAHSDFDLTTVRDFYCDDLGYNEWVLTGTTTAGEAVETHGVDFFRFQDGVIVEKSSFKKV